MDCDFQIMNKFRTENSVFLLECAKWFCVSAFKKKQQKNFDAISSLFLTFQEGLTNGVRSLFLVC